MNNAHGTIRWLRYDLPVTFVNVKMSPAEQMEISVSLPFNLTGTL